MSNEELLADQMFHDKLNSYASYIGLTASAAGAKDVIQTAWKSKKLSRGGIATLVLWGALLFNYSELTKANKELSNRSELLTSPHYQ